MFFHIVVAKVELSHFNVQRYAFAALPRQKDNAFLSVFVCFVCHLAKTTFCAKVPRCEVATKKYTPLG